MNKTGLIPCSILRRKPGPFTTDDQQKFDALVKTLEHLNNIPGLGITEREQVAIVTALKYG